MITIPGNVETDEDGLLKVDLTAMIDVIFTLIAFMMIIINVPVQMMEVDLPDTDQASASAVSENVVLHVVSDEQSWQLDGDAATDRAETLSALAARMAALEDPLPILVTIDENAPVQRMVDTFALLQEGGFENVSIVAEAAGGASE